MKKYTIAIDRPASFVGPSYEYAQFEAENELMAIETIQRSMRNFGPVFLVKIFKPTRNKNLFNPIINVRSDNMIEVLENERPWEIYNDFKEFKFEPRIGK